jgi:hypothetical protein
MLPVSAHEGGRGSHAATQKALRAIAERWLDIVRAWDKGREYEGFRIAGGHRNRELSPLLETRAKMFIHWAADDSFREDESHRVPSAAGNARSVIYSWRGASGSG